VLVVELQPTHPEISAFPVVHSGLAVGDDVPFLLCHVIGVDLLRYPHCLPPGRRPDLVAGHPGRGMPDLVAVAHGPLFFGGTVLDAAGEQLPLCDRVDLQPGASASQAVLSSAARSGSSSAP